jgi:hypothetical protein
LQNSSSSWRAAVLEPVFCLPTIQNDLQTPECHRYREDSPSVDLQFSAFACRFHFPRKFRLVGQEPAGQELATEAFDYAWHKTVSRRLEGVESSANSVDLLKKMISNFVEFALSSCLAAVR